MLFRFSLYGFLKNLKFFEPFLILIFREIGLSYLEIGLLYSIRGVSINVLEVPSGVFADTFGKIKSMYISMTSYALSFVIFYMGDSFYLFALAMVLFGVGETFRSGCHKGLIMGYLKVNNREDEKVSYYGKTRFFSQLGSAVCSLLALLIFFFSENYRVMFLVSVIPYIINIFNFMTYPSHIDIVKKKKKKSFRSQYVDSARSLFALFKEKRNILLIANTSIYGAVFKVLKDYIQPIIQTMALSFPLFMALEGEKRSALFIGVIYFFIYIGTSLASRYASLYEKGLGGLAPAMNSTYMMTMVSLCGCGLGLLFEMPWLSIMFFVLVFLLFNLRKPASTAMVSDRIPDELLVSTLSLESQLVSLIMIIAAPLIGLSIDKFSLGAVFVALGVVLFMLQVVVYVPKKG